MGGAGLIVLDTCAIIWLVLEPQSLTQDASEAIEKAIENQFLLFSTISHWEIAHAFFRKSINFDRGYKEFISLMHGNFSFREIEIKPEIAELSVSLPREINNDPADRIIAATSIILGAPLVTADKNLRKSKLIKTIW